MKKKAKDLTQSEREAFTEAFYSICPVEDFESPQPWGCPWDWAPDKEFDTATLKSEARRFYEENKDSIEETTSEEE